ncbi:MAG: hypothetical protein QM632_03440 [Micrococcaceae bacterium]
MGQETSQALDALLEAYKAHFAAVKEKQSEEDPNVESAFYKLADAFEAYEQSLAEEYDEVTPFEVYEDEDEAEEATTTAQTFMFDDDIDFEDRS